jgi:hypothetical protein
LTPLVLRPRGCFPTTAEPDVLRFRTEYTIKISKIRNLLYLACTLHTV